MGVGTLTEALRAVEQGGGMWSRIEGTDIIKMEGYKVAIEVSTGRMRIDNEYHDLRELFGDWPEGVEDVRKLHLFLELHGFELPVSEIKC